MDPFSYLKNPLRLFKSASKKTLPKLLPHIILSLLKAMSTALHFSHFSLGSKPLFPYPLFHPSTPPPSYMVTVPRPPKIPFVTVFWVYLYQWEVNSRARLPSRCAIFTSRPQDAPGLSFPYLLLNWFPHHHLPSYHFRHRIDWPAGLHF